MQLKNKVAIVTGGASGIGKACVRRMVAEGARVVIVDRDPALGQSLADDLGDQALFVRCDVSQAEDWQQVFAKTLEQWGEVHVLVNNAGISGMGPDKPPQTPEDFDLSVGQQVWSVNFESVVLGSQLAIKHMKQNGGAIVNVGSRAGLLGLPDCVFYSASKAAVRNYTQATAMYCAKHGYPIRCNSISPGLIKTPMILGGKEEMTEHTQRMVDLVKEYIPLDSMGKAEDIANAVVFLASNQSAYMTGSDMVIDGGMLVADPPSMKHVEPLPKE